MRNQSVYKSYQPEQMEELLSNYLLSNWSYSKVTSFARNEKAFEKSYIFGVYSKSSATTIAGQAYHKALEYFFSQLKEGIQVDLAELELSAFEHINNVPANIWKIQKTTPTIEDCQQKAFATATALLKNFMGELSTYTDDMAEVLGVEVYCDEFLTINGVDIPMQCHAKIDLVIKTNEGKVVIIDHKSKNSYSSDDEVALSIGVQAITYIKAYEEKTGITVDEVRFIENKYPKNKDGAKQLVSFPVTLDSNTRKLYELMLYEPLRRMLEAVSNPDYIYLINESDNYEDKSELYDFWCRTQICEVDDFNVEESKKELISKRLKKIKDANVQMIPPSVIKKFQEGASHFITYDLSNKNMTQSEKIEHTLTRFATPVRVAYTFEGFSSNTYLLEIQPGVKVSSIHNKRLDLANALDVPNVRISSDLVVHEGRSYLAVEFSKKREINLNFDPSELHGLKIPVGKDNFGNTVIWDLNNHSSTNVLVCGSIGSGKSVCLASTIEYAKQAGVDDIIIFDPKYEFTGYDNQMNTYVYNDILDIEEQAANLLVDMEQRIRDKRSKITLVIFDEFADAFANARKGNELKVYKQAFDGFYANGGTKQKRVQSDELNSLEENIRILLQKGRSSGFRVMMATQRASAKIISGDLKVNLPVQICFRVPKEIDSRVVLDEPGAESLAGMGDGLIKSPEYSQTTRFQAFYIDQSKHELA